MNWSHGIVKVGLCLCLSGGFADIAQSQQQDEEVNYLNDLETFYFNHQRDSRRLLSSIPITHISPAKGKVTGAIEAHSIDTIVYGEDPEITDTPSNKLENMTIKGHTFAPYLSLSLKNLGLGIAGEQGRRLLKYTPNTEFGNWGTVEESQMDYSGLGIYLFLNPLPRSRKAQWNLVLGSKLLNVKHQARSFYLGSSSANYLSEWEEFKYTITRSTIGTNVRYALSKQFFIIPWMDYERTDTSQADSVIERTRVNRSGNGSWNSSDLTHYQRFGADMELFWKEKAPLQYGIDFSVKMGKFDVHIGDLLGLVFSNELDEPRVNDSGSFSISVSYDVSDR